MDVPSIMGTVANYTSYGMIVLYLLVVTVNIITEVLKRLIPIPTDIVVFLVSIAVTMLALFIGSSVLMIHIQWYYIVSAAIAGIFVAYAAMFGFDKFRDFWNHLNSYGK